MSFWSRLRVGKKNPEPSGPGWSLLKQYLDEMPVFRETNNRRTRVIYGMDKHWDIHFQCKHGVHFILIVDDGNNFKPLLYFAEKRRASSMTNYGTEEWAASTHQICQVSRARRIPKWDIVLTFVLWAKSCGSGMRNLCDFANAYKIS